MTKSDQRRGFSVGALPPCVNQLPKPTGVVVAMAHRRVMLTVAGVDAPGITRFAVTREINDGLIAPRFSPSTRAFVLTGVRYR
jgi:hypothetical protein